MPMIEKSQGKRRHWPLGPQFPVAAIAAGSAADPSPDEVLGVVPSMPWSHLPLILGAQQTGSLPLSAMTLGQAAFTAQAASATAGNATNNADLRLNVYRAGVLQGCIAYYSLAVATTLGTATTAGSGAQTVTPAAMTGIVNGMALEIDSGGSNPEIVYAYNVTSTTFTADFLYSHTTSATVTTILAAMQPVPFVPALAASTTSSTAVASSGSHAITPASMYGIHVGDLLSISGGTGTAETVKVTAVTATTCTATWANTHSGTYNIATVGTTNDDNTIVTNQPFVLQGGDVLALGRVSNNVTGIATPAGLLSVDWVPSGINR